MKNDMITDERTDWKGLHAAGGAAALLSASAYIIGGIVAGPPNMQGLIPTSVGGWFDCFKRSPVTGMFLLGLPDIVIALASVPLFVALYAVFMKGPKTVPALAAGFGFTGLCLYLATNTSFAMLDLSMKYARTTIEYDKELLLSAGQAVLSGAAGTGALFSLTLIWLACLLFSCLMVRRKTFGVITAWTGVAGFALLLSGLLAPGNYTTTEERGIFAAAVTAVSYAGGGLASLAWYILIGLRLLKSERGTGRTTETHRE